MHRQKVGKTNLEIYPVVLGTVGAGKVFGDDTLDKIIRKYMDLGGNVLDSARMYADGESEKALGRWFESSKKRNEVILITKGGHPRLETMHTGRMSEADMRSDIEESLSALKTDCIDLYFFHRDDPNQPVAESIEIMEKFVKEGKIRYYGCSNWSAARMEEALQYSDAHGLQGFAANQALFNVGQKYMKPFPDDTMVSMDSAMQKLHTEREILSMPYFSVCSGFFYILKAAGEDAVKASPYYSEGNVKMAKRIYQLAEEHHTSITNILLNFFFVHPFANCPLYGPTEPDQLNDLADLFDVTLSKEDFDI